MTCPDLSKLAILPIAASACLVSPLATGQAQTVQQGEQSNFLNIEGIRGEETTTRGEGTAGAGEVFFPGDTFSRAFPGDTFTPRQRRAIEAQGIRTLADFIAADAVVIGRIMGTSPGTVRQWQQDIRSRLR